MGEEVDEAGGKGMGGNGDHSKDRSIKTKETSKVAEYENEERPIGTVAVDLREIFSPAVVSPEIDGIGGGGIHISVVYNSEMIIKGKVIHERIMIH